MAYRFAEKKEDKNRNQEIHNQLAVPMPRSRWDITNDGGIEKWKISTSQTRC